jgi:hypothetical protein
MEHVRRADIDSALLNFYEGALSNAAGGNREQEAKLRLWFERQLITPAGTRAIVFRGVDKTAGLPNETVDALEKLRLVRSEERGGGARWYEVTHDRFVDTIRKSREKWWAKRNRASAKQTLHRLEARTAEWVRADKNDSGLFDAAELLEATRLRDSPDAGGFGFSPELTALIDRSQAKRDAERFRKQFELQSRLLQLVAQVHRRKEDDADLALLLSLEANRIYEVIKQTGDLPGESADSLAVEAREGLVAALDASPSIFKFLHGHSDRVSSVVFDKEGRFMATGSYDGTVILWNASGYPISPPLTSHTGHVMKVALSPDGQTLASCGADGTQSPARFETTKALYGARPSVQTERSWPPAGRTGR